MKILLVENDDEKAASIKAVIERELEADEVELSTSSTVNETLVRLGETKYDLVIVDLVLPQVAGGEDVDATPQWCELIENHLAGRTTSWIVMTGYYDVVEPARQSFARHNVAVIQYDLSREWEAALAQKIRDNYATRPLDFLIVCALEKERRGFFHAPCQLGERTVIAGLDCQMARINGLRGTIVVQPGPGMISAAIVSTKALAVFRPRAIAMAGICGGRADETSLGALVIPDLSWNYQSGKFIVGRLTPDLLQVALRPTVRATLSILAADPKTKELRQGLMNEDLVNAPFEIKPMVSGSQVVADVSVAAVIGEQGRKVAGIDMEVASVYFAAQDFFDGGGIYFAAKTVVDLADERKDDRFHEYGCGLSARFVAVALDKLLSEHSE